MSEKVINPSSAGVEDDAMPRGIDTSLFNDDLAPAKSRDWSFYSLFAMWMSDIHSIGGYTFAAGLFALGLSAALVFAGLSVGIVIVFLLMNLVGYAGQKTGLCYPVLARISFGVYGSNLPALTRGFVAICWYGIQTWLASKAVIVLVGSINKSWIDWGHNVPWREHPWLGCVCLNVDASAAPAS